VRRLLEHLAARGPVVLVVDDIHWAETTFLDLLGHLLAETESQLFVLCTARNDLLERQPDWGEGPHQGRVVLQPLTDADVGDVVRNLLGGSGIDAAIQERIVIAAEGNPLFVEQLLSMLVESDLMQQVDGRWMARSSLSTLAIPPSLQALLSARLDQLEREERAVLEPASVIGLEFATEAVRALAPEPVQPQVETHLAAIQRRELIRPATSTSLDGDAYRFGHILIRDAAYQRLLKRARATLHARFAEWADATNRQRERSQEFEEILGYHLEQAHRYLSELGPLDDQGRNLGARAGALLGGAGRRAMARGDAPAAVNLLGRAAACLVDDAPARLAVLPDLGEAMLEHGELAGAEQLLDEAVRAAGELGEQRTAAAAELTLLMVRLYAAENVDWSAVALRKVEEVLPIFERSQDHAGLAMAGRLRYAVHGAGCRYGEAAVAAEQVMEQARAANDSRLATRGASGYAISVLFGPMPVPEAIERCERVATQVAGDRRTEALIRTVLAQLHAMGGDIARARELYRSSRAMLEELGGGVVSASTSIDSARIELLGGDIAAAERELRRDYQALSGMGERFLLATVGAMLGRVECMLGNYDEAETLGRVVSELAMPDDVDAQALWRSLLAICLARRGETAEALELGRQAVTLRRATDSPVLLAEALGDLAEVEDRAGHDGSAGELRHEALALYERKGDLVSAGRLRMLLS
jgi:tetratricopeptide (TPR) repeat protein